jgi:hypothetical protein
MRKVSHRHLWRHAFLLAAVFTTGVLASAIEARAVILYSTDVRNTSPPSDAEGLAAWKLEATWGTYLATPIDATHFMVARHCYGYGTDPTPTTISFLGGTYTVDTGSRVWDNDLCIYSIVGSTFPNYATLYNEAVDGPETDKVLTVFGCGRKRGGEVKVGSTLKGWYWGDVSLVPSWGQNIVTGFKDFSTSSTDSLLYFNFDADGIANEAMVSQYDSAGGVFIYSNGQWKLAGINYAVDCTYSYTATGLNPDGSSAVFTASIFDQQGLYVQDNQGKWVPAAGPGASYASRISSDLGWIEEHAPGVIVPEPATLMLLISGAMSLAVFGRFARRRKAS